MSKFKIFIFGALGILTFVFLWGYINNYLQRSRASIDGVNVTVTPKSGDLAVSSNQTADIVLQADSSRKISSFDLTLNASGNAEIVSVSDVKAVGSNANFNQLISQIGPKSSRVVYVSQSSTSELPSAVSFKLTFKGSSIGVGGLKIDQSKSQVVGTAAGSVFQWGTVNEGNYNFVQGTGGGDSTGGGTQGQSIDAKINPALGTFLKNGEFSVKLEVVNPPTGRKISGADTALSFSSNLVELKSVTGPAGFSEIKKQIDNTNGKANLTYVSTNSTSQLPSSILINLTFMAKGTIGRGDIKIDTIQVTGDVTGGQYTVNKTNGAFNLVDQLTTTVTPGVTGGVTPPTGGSGNTTLNLQIRLQGVTTKPTQDSIKVRVGLANVGMEPIYNTTQFIAGDGGIWSGSTAFNVPTGSTYIVYIKGPKHLQKKMCDSISTETTPGTYRCSTGKIALNTGTNNLNFSGIRQLVGDLPEQGTEGQNGIVDSFDLSFIRQNLGSKETNVLAIGDLNYDGIIDSQDFSLVIASLNVKVDEL